MNKFIVGLAVFALVLPIDSLAGETATREFRDCHSCPLMVEIPAGSFEMGGKAVAELGFSPEPEELPRRVVRVPGFALGKFEVTQAEWVALMGDNPSDYDDGTGILPVETVSWRDAKEYIRRLSRKTGHRYRLPTEAEWEYAARAGQDGLYSFGNDMARLEQYAWFNANAGGHIHPVGTKSANAFGLHDMHGNVWEWVEDCYFPSYFSARHDAKPTRSVHGCQRNNRGGSWVNAPLNLRASHRHKMGAGSRGTFIGFRVAMTIEK